LGELIRLTSYLLRLSRGIKLSRMAFVGMIATGLASGLTLAALVAITNARLAESGLGLAWAGWLFLIFAVARPLCNLLGQALVQHLTEHTFFQLRHELSLQILVAPLRRLEALGRARLLATLTNDVGKIVEAIVLIPTIVMQLSVVAAFLVYLGWLYWPLLPPLFAVAAFGVFTSRWSVNGALKRFSDGRQIYDRLFEQFRGLTEGTKELKMHAARREAFVADLAATSRAHRREMRLADLSLAAAAAWTELLFFAVIGLLLFAVPARFQVSPEIVSGYVLTILMIRAPLEGLNRTLSVLSQAAISVQKIEEVSASLADEPPEENAPNARTFPAIVSTAPTWNVLTLERVTHRYGSDDVDESFRLGPIDLTVQPGETLFIIGGNGSGKTTLGKILLGLYAPEQGRITLGGREIDDRNRDAYRQLFSAVFADFFLFDSLLGLDAPGLDAAAHKYLARLHLQQHVGVRDGRLSTLNLSQGQRKRLALLIAYLEDRPAYLFDEWAADQDPQFKRTFYLELLPELKARGKTLIVISHDDRYYGVADRIIKLDYGAIEFDGGSRDYENQYGIAGAPRSWTRDLPDGVPS
jgi:putative pyoverdin transport system ATP-binding/permease protein